jgi:hypothetical protein
LQEIQEVCANFNQGYARAELCFPNSISAYHSISLYMVDTAWEKVAHRASFIPVADIETTGKEITVFWQKIADVCKRHMTSSEAEKIVTYTGWKVAVILHRTHMT